MKIEKITYKNTEIAHIKSEEPIITDAQSAIDLMMTANYEAGTKNIAISKDLIVNEFFILSSGLAGEILQKFINYKFRIAIYGDYSKYTSKPLKEFIYESNSGRGVFFTENLQTALEILSENL